MAEAKSPKKILWVLYKAAGVDLPLVSLFLALQAAHHPGSACCREVQLAKAWAVVLETDGCLCYTGVHPFQWVLWARRCGETCDGIPKAWQTGIAFLKQHDWVGWSLYLANTPEKRLLQLCLDLPILVPASGHMRTVSSGLETLSEEDKETNSWV